MSSPLDRYRTSAQPQAADELDTYQAFGVVSPQPRRLAVCRRNQANRHPGYSYLIDVIEDGALGREIGLIYSHVTVLIKGRNLQDLAQQLAMEKVGRIQEFDGAKWAKPAPDEAVIESIEYKTRLGVDEAQGKAAGQGSK